MAQHAKTRPLLVKVAFAAGFLLLPAGLIIAPPQFEAAESTTFSTQAAGSTACSSIATGGNEISEINLAGTTYCRHVFTASGSFTVLDPRLTTVDYLIVGGGGGGAARDVGGGGGAGGVVSNLNPGGTNTAGLAVPHNVAVTVTVGAGGAGSTNPASFTAFGATGGSSTLGDLTAVGGGGGGNVNASGRPGGSGGGSGRGGSSGGAASPEGQGNPGGLGSTAANEGGGAGGGGAGQPGGDAGAAIAGNGGDGLDYSSLLGADIGVAGWFAGGGAGATHRLITTFSGGSGGEGGGGNMGALNSGNGFNGDANTGGGGGASRREAGHGGAGGSGIVVVRYVLPPQAMAVCDGTSTQNDLTVTAGHGRVFYIDSAPGQDLDAAYLSYTVTSAAARSGLWVQLSDFSGQVVSLAEPSQALHPLEPIAAGGSQAAFAMVKANRATKVAQSHQVRVFDRKPSSSSVQPLYSCAFSFVEVRETLKAQSNQVLEISADSDIRLGGEVVVTVRGETGLIGKGNNIDGRVVWLSPAARSSWPSASLRLERTEIEFFSDADRNNPLTTHVNTLRVNEAIDPPLSSNNRQFYTAVYTFRVVGPGANSPIIPVSTVSSGTQMKHADAILAAGIASVDLSAPQVDVTLTKDVNTTTAVNADGTTTVTYELTLTNNGTAAVSVDEVIDSPDGVLSYLSGSSELDGTAIADPLVDSAGNLLYSGPITIAAGATRTLSYQMRAVTCAPGGEFKFTNTATARIGSVVVGSSTATKTVVNLLGQCGEAEASKQVEEVALDPEVFTGAANTVTETSAQLTGSVDSNGEAGLAVRFRLSKDSSLATNSTLISAGTSSNSADATAITAAATGLDPDTTYYYRAEVVVDSNTVIEGEILSFTTAKPPALPEVTTEPASFVTANSAALNGLVNPNRVEDGAKVSFEWQPAAAGPTCEANQSALDAGGTSSGFLQSDPADGPPATDEILAGQSEVSVSYELTALTANSEWCYRVVAHHGTGFATQTVGDWVSFRASARTAQTITWNPRGDPLPAGGTTTVLATGGASGQPINYSSVDVTICTVNATTGLVTAVATSGNCTITATQDGNASFEPAIPSTLSFAISPPVVATAFLTDGTYQASLNRTLAATGGNGNYADWQVTAGGLPAGVTLDATTGELTGTPTEAGSFSFTVTTVSNGVTSAPKTLVLQIAKLPLTVTASNATVEYLAPPPTVTPSYSGFVATDDAQILITQPTCGSDYQVGDVVDTTATTSCSGGWSDRYTLSYQTGTLTVTARSSTSTPDPSDPGQNDPGQSLTPILCTPQANPLTPTPGQTLSASDFSLIPGPTPGSVTISYSGGSASDDDAPFAVASVSTSDPYLDVGFAGADFNKASTWQSLGYGSICFKLEPFEDDDYHYTLPLTPQLPPGYPVADYVYSNVIVKAGSLVARSDSYQTDTIFANPQGGHKVFADVNANGILDPGGTDGDRSVSHVIVCVTIAGALAAQANTASKQPSQQPVPEFAVSSGPGQGAANAAANPPALLINLPQPAQQQPAQPTQPGPIAEAPSLAPVVAASDCFNAPIEPVLPEPTPEQNRTSLSSPNPAPTQCTAADGEVAILVSNGITATCLRYSVDEVYLTAGFFALPDGSYSLSPTETPTALTPTNPSQPLANTGFELWWLTLWAALLVTLGTMTVATNRRKP